ncbi:MAG: formylglycine-generating enzyme family protein [Trueperaceae bacterium]
MLQTKEKPTLYPIISIPGGVIELRDDRVKKQWRVELDPFLLGQYPVTTAFYLSMTKAAATFSGNGHKPVVNVSWYDAVLFCNWLSHEAGLSECYSLNGEHVIWDKAANGYRLPTEAEWQYACQAGNKKYRYGELEAIAWYRGNSSNALQEVGKKEPNAWGLYDMLGNIWEWCWDIYDEQVYGPYRVFRGGGWAEEARGCGATCRRRSHPTFKIDDLGFRLARSV